MPELVLPFEPVVRTALARGPGYEPQPPGSFFDPHSVRGYFVDLRAKTTAESARDTASLGPAALAQLALGWWDRAEAGDRGALAAFEQTARLLETRAERAADGLRWPYLVPVPKYGLRAPWYSAMAQGQAASVFVRAHLSTHDDRHRGLAEAAIRPLLAETDTDLVSIEAEGPVLEEAPSDPRSHILNGWIYALWGLWDVAVAFDDDEAARRFEASAACLASLLDRYDAGWWTRYSLYPHRLDDLAKPFYHALHATQADVLHTLTERPEFARAARRWRRYDTLPRRGRALAQKAAFVLVARPRN
jgi:heparosan-N-sulfate-glucuronate 5-epimerase